MRSYAAEEYGEDLTDLLWGVVTALLKDARSSKELVTEDGGMHHTLLAD